MKGFIHDILRQLSWNKYSKTCVKWPFSKKDQKLVFKTNYRLMQVKSIAECSNGAIVGILTFINMINTTSERLTARNFFICRYFSYYKQLKFWAQLS